jgi:YggT family protein
MTINPDPADQHRDVLVRQGPGYAEREEVVVDEVAERRTMLYRVSQFIWLLAGMLETLLGLRVFLKLIGANPEAGFSRFIYGMSELFVWPFNSLTATPVYGSMALDINTMIAMIVYAILALIVIQAIWLLLFRNYTTSRVTQRRVGP